MIHFWVLYGIFIFFSEESDNIWYKLLLALAAPIVALLRVFYGLFIHKY